VQEAQAPLCGRLDLGRRGDGRRRALGALDHGQAGPGGARRQQRGQRRGLLVPGQPPQQPDRPAAGRGPSHRGAGQAGRHRLGRADQRLLQRRGANAGAGQPLAQQFQRPVDAALGPLLAKPQLPRRRRDRLLVQVVQHDRPPVALGQPADLPQHRHHQVIALQAVARRAGGRRPGHPALGGPAEALAPPQAAGGAAGRLVEPGFQPGAVADGGRLAGQGDKDVLRHLLGEFEPAGLGQGDEPDAAAVAGDDGPQRVRVGARGQPGQQLAVGEGGVAAGGQPAREASQGVRFAHCVRPVQRRTASDRWQKNLKNRPPAAHPGGEAIRHSHVCPESADRVEERSRVPQENGNTPKDHETPGGDTT
jgi:hypothetical protein